MVDAVVVGAGHNGLVAANLLADAGWEVIVLEEQPDPGGAVRSAELTAPGFVNDVFSAFYPLGAASPVIRALHLERHGLRWRHAPLVLAHPLPDGRAAVLSRDLGETTESVAQFAPADGEAWRVIVAEWQEIGPAVIDALFRPFPPVLPGARLLRRLGPAGTARLARFALLSVRRYVEERFAGEGAQLLVAGNALHTDMSPEGAGSAVFGWLLAMLGQEYGFPAPEGGAGRLIDALVARLRSCGGELWCAAPVVEIVVRNGRAVGVRTAGGDRIVARRAVLADVTAPMLYQRLLRPELLPGRLVADLDRFQWDNPTVKIDWALSGPIPWRAPAVGRAGTVHLADGMAALTDYSADLAVGRFPRQPFAVLGQMTATDPSRSPAGTESAWAYTHVPCAAAGDEGGLQRQATLLEEVVERYAPGFRDLILARHVLTPQGLQDRNSSLVRGAINGGTAAIHQQLIFRPVPGLGRPETPVRALYLASASAHPGGGVHGAPGANAARAALAANGMFGPLYDGLWHGAGRLLWGSTSRRSSRRS
jgi:phytoene dehydrogenase-like protein